MVEIVGNLMEEKDKGYLYGIGGFLNAAALNRNLFSALVAASTLIHIWLMGSAITSPLSILQ